jgi:Subunit CCDC53 of WASH complex
MVRFGFSPGNRQSRKERIDQAKKELETKRETEAEKSRRRNFGFLKNADNRLNKATLSKTREHAKELAMAWNEPLETPTSFSSGQVLLQTNEVFDPFGHGANSSADTPNVQFSFSSKRTVTNASGSLLDQNFTSTASPEPTASTLDTFETASVGSAYDMDFFPSKPSNAFPPASFSSSHQKPPIKKALDPFANSAGPGPGGYSGKSIDAGSVPSMPTVPTNSTMLSGYAKQSTASAAARRKFRSQMRNSSNHSTSSSVTDEASHHSGMGTPPESPARSITSGVPGSVTKNRLPAYQRPQNGSFHSAASSGNNSNQSSTNRPGSVVSIFDVQNPNGGFTFDAFGLDQAQVEKEVNDAMHALAGQGMPGFSVFFNNDTDGDFSSQGWDSPATSRRSSPAPSDSEKEGFVDGFRISPTPHRGADSPASSERSFSSPASRGVIRGHAGESITTLRWGDSPEQGSKDVFGAPVSNPWKEDPWGSEDEGKYFSDSGADSDFGGTKSEIVNSFFGAKPQFKAKFSDSKSDIGASAYQKSVSFHKDVRSPPQNPVKNFDDESSDDSAGMKDELAREYAREFVQRVSPRHTKQSASQGGRTFSGKQPQPENEDPFAFESGFVNSFGQAQEEMFQAEFGFPSSASDFGRDERGFDFGAVSPSRGATNFGRPPTEQDTAERHNPRPALHTNNNGQAPRYTTSLSDSVRTKYQGSRGAPTVTNVTESGAFPSQVAQKPQSSYGKLRNSYEAAKSRLSSDRIEPFPSSSSISDDFTSETSSSRVEEKKDDEEKSTSRADVTNARDSEWRPLTNQSGQMVAPQQAPTWKQNSQGNPHSAISGVEMLTPDMVEARRQEKRKHRVDELRKAHEENSGVLKKNNSHEKSVAVSQQRATECQVERTSFASLRERLKPSATSKAKSVAGADVMPSYVSNVVDRLRKESPRAVAGSEAKSDVGSSPSFSLGVMFQQPARDLPENDGRSRLEGVNVDSPSSKGSGSAPRFTARLHTANVPSPTHATSNIVQIPAERKLTYRERRELELQQVQVAKPEPEKKEPQKDVAALIRKRIASNKLKNTLPPNIDTVSSQGPQFQGNLKSVTSPAGQSPTKTLKEEKNGQQQPSPTKFHEQPKYPPRVEPSYQASPKVRSSRQAFGFSGSEVEYDAESAHVDDISSAAGARSSSDSYQPRTVSSLGSKGPASQSPRRPSENSELGDERYATSDRLEALLSKKKEEPKDFNVHSVASSVPKPVNKPAFEPPPDGAAGKNDVKAMLSSLLGARMNPFASLPAPKREDDADAIMELKSFESKHSPEKNAAQSPSPPRPPSAVTNGQRPPLKDDPKYERYFRMLKVGMPMEVVKHAMLKDGNDPSVMDADHNLPVGQPLKEDPQYTKYFKMLKMGITMAQVKHSMERDGLNPDVMDQDHNLPASTSGKRSNNEPVQKDTKRRARLHWKTLGKITRNSLWSKIEKEPEVTNIAFDEDEFQELFQADLTPSVTSPKGIGATRKKGAAVRVIDAKRANNGGIILARVKMSHDQMADVVDRMYVSQKRRCFASY